MSTDYDDQADQQHKLPDPGMAETDRSKGFKTYWTSSIELLH